MQAVGFAARIRWRKANKFVIARALCARGNLGQAVAILPIAFPRCGRVLRDSHVASLLGMTILIALRRRITTAIPAAALGAHNPQGARRIRKSAKPPTAAQ